MTILRSRTVVGSDPVIIPYKVMNWLFITLFGKVAGLLSVRYR